MLSSGGAWVGASAAATTFVNIQPDAGTSPVADQPNDTLTLAGGTGITTTGDATTDTVTIAITDAELVALAGLTSAADKGIQFTGVGTAATYDLTAAGKALLDDADAAAQRTTLGVGTGDSPQFTALNIGHASDTTIARVSAGVISVEGSNVLLASGLGSITQAYDAELAAIAGLTSAADRLPYFTGSGTASLATFTGFARTLLDDADNTTARSTLGLGTSATVDTGTSGATIPLLSGTNTHSGVTTFSDTTATSSPTTGGVLFKNIGVETMIFSAAVRIGTAAASNSGKLGILTNPSTTDGVTIQSQTSDTGSIMTFRKITGQSQGSIGVDGTNTSFNTSSDFALKHKFNEAGVDWNAVIDNVWVGDFEFKSKAGSTRLGIVAQWTHEHYPQAVTIREDGESCADYGQLAPLALYGVKALRTRIAELESRVAALENPA